MNKCPRCENEKLKKGQNFCQICGLNLRGEERRIVISNLKYMESYFKKVEANDSDIEEIKLICIETLEYAIKELERTAQEVPVQEQLVKSLEGITLSKWEQLRNCIDREFKSQVNKTTFKLNDTFKKNLEIDITQ